MCVFNPFFNLVRADSETILILKFICSFIWKSWWPPKLGIIIIISCIQLIFFLSDEIIKKVDSTNSTTGPIAELFTYDPMKTYEFWRYLTYMFVHTGYAHLFENVVFQIIIGNFLEKNQGCWSVLVIYFAGVVAGSLGTSIINPTRSVMGGSGGGFSILTACIPAIVMNWKEKCLSKTQLAMLFSVIVLVVGFVMYIIQDWFKETAHVAHFFGALAGFLVGILVLEDLTNTDTGKIIWYIALAVIVVLAGIYWNISCRDCFFKQI
ncbi:hypothetical protein Zmor_017175 [Zophobas morio]|uniref:Peptidase S54 rhomboid domain-containing protein n=1 Tax=Zophobas morio TaxID=2755281 RepID=A0AA38IBW1_9CUCU|nr:hypothetical protein Zmor_017175 [Zophobas morio]